MSESNSILDRHEGHLMIAGLGLASVGGGLLSVYGGTLDLDIFAFSMALFCIMLIGIASLIFEPVEVTHDEA